MDMEVSHELEKIKNNMEFLTRALSRIPNGHPGTPMLLDNLGGMHNERFNIQYELDDLEKAIKYKSIALTLTPDNDMGLWELLASLTTAHIQRFKRLGDLHDVEKAMKYGHISADLIPGANLNLPILLANLGTAHNARFKVTGHLADLEDAIQHQSHALALTPDHHPSLPAILNALGVTHDTRYKHLGEPKDLEEAIKYGSHALALTPDGHPDSPWVLMCLGAAHSDRYECQGQLCDLEDAIEYESRAVALTPDGHPDLPNRLANLGASHSNRFHRLGGLNDLEDAIEYQSLTLALTPDGHPDLPGRLANLGVRHSDRFEHLGELSDLEHAVTYHSRALVLTPEGTPDLPDRLINLGASYMIRFKRSGELKDLEDGMKHQSRALALIPDGHPNLQKILANLGLSHGLRFRQLREPSDLENAMKYQSRAVMLTPDGHPDLPTRLFNLASSYTERFEYLGEPVDVENASKYESRALALTPDGHPAASKVYFNYGLTQLRQYRLTEDDSHLQHSFDSFRHASQSLTGAPRDKFNSAQTWAKFASLFNPHNSVEAYQTAIDLLPQFIWLGATISQRYEDLSTSETLAVNAANAAIRCSDHNLALEWLEHARCVVWNQSLMLRSPVDELRSMHPDLGMRLQTIANQLQTASSNSRESRALASVSITIEQVAQEHRRIAKEYNDLLARIRTLPGFENFLRPKKTKHLVQAARTGPVVVINCHESQCDAIVVLPGEEDVQYVPLPDFSAQTVQEARQTLESSLRRKGIRERGVKVRQEPGGEASMSSMLAALWHNVVRPILDHLGYMNNDSSINLPHITWCPTGALSFLPLHAAGDYDQPRSRVFDYVVSSYTPTLTALMASASSSSNADCRVLAISQTNTPGHSVLPGTARELAHVQAHTRHNAGYSQLIGSQATVLSVLDQMEQHDWVHLACHAHQNVNDPTKSGFFLHDGTLDLAAINRRSFKGKGLAFLSACQTATGDERLADEAVHLASGMLMAGYTSVIATMWSVHDEDAPIVADEVYAQLMKDRKVGNGEAGKALHHAVATLRATVGEQKFERWVPYIHIGS